MAENNPSDGRSSEQPIIIKKIKKGGHGHHGGAWKVAYADFVTAMMAFFIVMWILAQGEDVKASIAEYFDDPGQFSVFTGRRTSAVDLDLPYPERGGGKNKKEENFSWSFSEGKKEDSASSADNNNAIMEQMLQDSISAVKKVEATSRNITDSLNTLKNKFPDISFLLESISISITKEGMVIELIEQHDNTFFEIGSAKLKPAAARVLSQIAKEIGKLPNNVEIEGHTDSRGYSSGSVYSNWELSSDRANAARRVLDNSGLWSGQVISVSGWADKKLRNETNPFDASNRRVSIIVKNITLKQITNGI